MTGASQAYHLLWQGLDWLYPPVCAGCDQPGWRWCPTCQEQAARFSRQICEQCGRPIRPGSAARCQNCVHENPPYQALRAWFVFGDKIRSAIHRLKYKRDLGLGEVFAGCLEELVNQQGWQIDLVVPVPLGKQRALERGYNQSSMLGFPLALRLGCKYQPGILWRAKETTSQVGLSGSERRTNLRDAFQARAAGLQGKRILLVDDVLTTGSTLSACAQALRNAGADKVYGIALARVAGFPVE